jgi:hypothetical protein
VEAPTRALCTLAPQKPFAPQTADAPPGPPTPCQAPEDAWLLQGLAGWLEGGALRALLGTNEVAYRRWQERVALAAVDDGAQLAPLSQVLPGAERERGGGRREREREQDDEGERGPGGAAAYAYAGPPVNRDTTSGWGLTYGTEVRLERGAPCLLAGWLAGLLSGQVLWWRGVWTRGMSACALALKALQSAAPRSPIPPINEGARSTPLPNPAPAKVLEPWHARAWKATAVVLMAERRIGEGDEFKRMLERVVVAARPDVAAGLGGMGG